MRINAAQRAVRLRDKSRRAKWNTSVIGAPYRASYSGALSTPPTRDNLLLRAMQAEWIVRATGNINDAGASRYRIAILDDINKSETSRRRLSLPLATPYPYAIRMRRI